MSLIAKVPNKASLFIAVGLLGCALPIVMLIG